MLPYVRVADLNVLGVHLHPFGLLVVTGVLVGIALTRWRARRHGLDLGKLESFLEWMLCVGFVSAHVLDAILYHPSDVLARPWSVLYVWDGIGSFSGFIGALLGIVLWKRFEWVPARSFGPWTVRSFAFGPVTLSKIARRKATLPILPFADLVLSVFPIAWVFGRTGCSIAHDHPGAQAAEGAALAVAYPAPNPAVVDGAGAHTTFGPLTFIQGHFPRYDLGTLELMLTIGIAVVFALLWRRRLLTGTYAVIASLVYAPVRFLLDFLRVADRPGADPRYGSLTPAQWLCVALFVFGLVLLRRVLVMRNRGPDPSYDLLAAEEPRGIR